MKKIILLITFLTGLYPTLSAQEKQELFFDVILFKKKVGWLKVSYQTLPDGTESYRLESRSGARFLWIDRDVYSVYETEYRHGRLIRSNYRETDKGVLKKHNRVTWSNNQYIVERLNGRGILGGVPETGIIQLYFKPMPRIQQLFNESEATFEKVTYEDNCLKFKGGEGQTNCYYYNKGVLDYVECEFSFATVRFQKSNAH